MAAAVDDSQVSGRQDRLTRVLSGWHQDLEFSRDGTPLELPLVAPETAGFQDG